MDDSPTPSSDDLQARLLQLEEDNKKLKRVARMARELKRATDLSLIEPQDRLWKALELAGEAP